MSNILVERNIINYIRNNITKKYYKVEKTLINKIKKLSPKIGNNQLKTNDVDSWHYFWVKLTESIFWRWFFIRLKILFFSFVDTIFAWCMELVNYFN